ncbi:MAG: hypothetical protein NTV23_09915 [Propionibacteriales bacterium]|nr:hypothetical protein [Propionibacteriales bacterium]
MEEASGQAGLDLQDGRRRRQGGLGQAGAPRPLRRAPDLVEIEGRETAPFKIDVRKLKGLGLTISHPVGYELSPRGLAYRARTARH